ncbi:hypothetical protein [Hyphomonas sp.]|uniref:hypothetical protein n=1 Tax=Hyphomonas sp. TaxID=87 RepID=UPI0037BECD57
MSRFSARHVDFEHICFPAGNGALAIIGEPDPGLLRQFRKTIRIAPPVLYPDTICAPQDREPGADQRFTFHWRWVTRLFLAASGVWFLRVMMTWAIPTGGAGLSEELGGPMSRAAMPGQTLIPLGVCQICLRAEEGRSARVKHAPAGLVSLLTLVMPGGILWAVMAMALPGYRADPRGALSPPRRRLPP